jgi:hypothetical protein
MSHPLARPHHTARESKARSRVAEAKAEVQARETIEIEVGADVTRSDLKTRFGPTRGPAVAEWSLTRAPNELRLR